MNLCRAHAPAVLEVEIACGSKCIVAPSPKGAVLLRVHTFMQLNIPTVEAAEREAVTSRTRKAAANICVVSKSEHARTAHISGAQKIRTVRADV